MLIKKLGTLRACRRDTKEPTVWELRLPWGENRDAGSSYFEEGGLLASLDACAKRKRAETTRRHLQRLLSLVSSLWQLSFSSPTVNKATANCPLLAWLNWPSFNFLGNLRAPEQSLNLSRMNVCCELVVELRELVRAIVEVFEVVPRCGTDHVTRYISINMCSAMRSKFPLGSRSESRVLHPTSFNFPLCQLRIGIIVTNLSRMNAEPVSQQKCEFPDARDGCWTCPATDRDPRLL